jgi:hypothetical protein
MSRANPAAFTRIFVPSALNAHLRGALGKPLANGDDRTDPSPFAWARASNICEWIYLRLELGA